MPVLACSSSLIMMFESNSDLIVCFLDPMCYPVITSNSSDEQVKFDETILVWWNSSSWMEKFTFDEQGHNEVTVLIGWVRDDSSSSSASIDITSEKYETGFDVLETLPNSWTNIHYIQVLQTETKQ